MGGPTTNLGFIVTKANVVQTYQLVQSEVDSLTATIEQNGFKLRIEACGQDPVSKDAVETFNPKLDRINAQATSYVRALADDAEQLRRTAQAYGFTEDQITGSLSSLSATLVQPHPQADTASSPQPPPRNAPR